MQTNQQSMMQFVQCALIGLSALIGSNVLKLVKLHKLVNLMVHFRSGSRHSLWQSGTYLWFSVVLWGESGDESVKSVDDPFSGEAAELLVKWFEALIRRVEGCWKVINSLISSTSSVMKFLLSNKWTQSSILISQKH